MPKVQPVTFFCANSSNGSRCRPHRDGSGFLLTKDQSACLLANAAKRLQSEPIAVMQALLSRLPCSGIAIVIVAGNGNDLFSVPFCPGARGQPRRPLAAFRPRRARSPQVAPGARLPRPRRAPGEATGIGRPVGSGCVLPRLRSAAARLPSAAGKPRPTPTERPVAKQPQERAAAASAAPASRSRPAGAGR